MCFSAEVSFGAGAVLLGTGILAMKRTGSPRMLTFAAGPVIFGLQQLSEGMLWLSFDHPEWVTWRAPSMYAFLFFAQVIWPLWVPLGLWFMEPERERRKIIRYFVWLGGLTSAFMLFCLFAYTPTAVAEAGHIRYSLNFPAMGLRRLLYGLSTVVPLFLSSLRWMKALAIALLASFILSLLFYAHFVISVWCFFAAVLSIMVYFIIGLNREVVTSSSV